MCAAVVGVSTALLAGTSLTKQVRLTVDGGVTTVRSTGRTVREVLAHVKVPVGRHDVVSPAPAEKVRDGGSIVVRHARPLHLTLDGRKSLHTVTALNVGEALEELHLAQRRARLSSPRMRQIPVTGFALDVRTERRVTVIRRGVRLDALTTGRTVRDVLAQQRIMLAKGDRVRPALGSFPEDSQVIRVIPAAPAVPPVPAPPPHTVPVRPSVTSLNWAALARCETYADPRSFNPSGPYYGMYQFSLPMWQAVGGTGTPRDWPPAEQTYRAQLLYQRVAGRWQGQWPTCGSHLFTP
ncbi:resuscitation-promoting factor [Sphaerisporangium sp. TRM90804]|uniref:resuscitation-promoting factor n=1 Tax=Sphaerisporangium sp. TRM90804 TaxID=3031113 RepID=UPI002448ECB6|nr:resuscitation-promoting factor [Sphaerisporangium sp. TRM90804]MDH2428716.1 ubiquitin-like domain-containing protein [Sphaerisporangium sp. TRM90804]